MRRVIYENYSSQDTGKGAGRQHESLIALFDCTTGLAVWRSKVRSRLGKNVSC